MKKLIISAAIAITAFCINAAQVSWSSTSIKDITGANIGGSSDFTAVVTFYTATMGDFSTTGNSSSTAKMSKLSGTTGDDFAANTKYFAQLVVTGKDGSKIESEVASFTTDSDAVFNINFTNGNGFDTATAKINYASGWTAAPEPTSGILLLLGVAGLALKRKRA